MLPLLLHIDTSTDFASIALTRGDHLLGMRNCQDQKQHGAFVQPAVLELMQAASLELKDLDAISVAEGPGSYTGLRVSMASAKGLAYALDKPLILVNTLKIMAQAAILEQATTHPNAIYCPLIDARRMEVFMAIYDHGLAQIQEPEARILDGDSFKDLLDQQPIVFSGTGAAKFQSLISHPNAIFSPVQHHAGHLAMLANQAFAQQAFANLAYAEPFYLKAFYSAPAKK